MQVSSNSEPVQSIIPLSGAVSSGHDTEENINSLICFLKLLYVTGFWKNDANRALEVLR